MKKIILSLAFILATIPQLTLAQGQVASRLIRGSNFQIGVGYHYQRADFQDLNTAINSAGYPSLSESIHSVSFMTQNISNHWVLTLRTSFSLKNEEETANREIEFHNQQYALGLGHNILRSERARLIPGIMATLSRNTLLLQNKNTGTTNFQGLLQNPTGEADLRNFSYLADTGLEFHYLFYRRERDNEVGRMSSWVPVIIKAGYQFQVGESDFEFDGRNVAGVPDISLGGFYASIHIGLGSRILP